MFRSPPIIGLMSGTSLDGLDIACCTFSLDGDHWSYTIEAADTIPYFSDWSDYLQGAKDLSGLELMLLDKAYGSYLAVKVMEFVEKNKLRPALIGSHGHTIFHQPDRGLSFQLGDGAALSAGTALPVVCDFRSLDVGLGGQGAPLVPVGDKLLFGSYDFCLNLGGIANISFEFAGRRIGFDICPCNILLNRLANQADLAYDPDGMIARQGRVDDQLLDWLNDWNYYQQPPPKSLDKDALLESIWPQLANWELPLENKLATLVEHIAQQVGIATAAGGSVLVTGGGARNDYLIRQFSRHSQAEFVIPEKSVIDFKEALVFAFLGLLRVRNDWNILAESTGALRDSVGGALHGKVDWKQWR